ncbi:MAG TPA: hypothetical protein VIC34_02425 [Croceibacterium sp.]|jgi:hypothetical protein
MCFPLFTLAFCAVFASAPAQSNALAPSVAGSAGTGAAATPVREPASGQASRSQGTRGGTQKEGVVVAVAQTSSDQRESASQSDSRDTESKGGRDSARETDSQVDTEAK